MPQQTVIFLGPQGSGKGTQASLLEKYLKKNNSRPVAHFTMGDALRDFMTKENYTSERIRSSMDRGELQPLFLAAGLLVNFLEAHIMGDTHLIIDGFPRTDTQVAILDSSLEFYNREPVCVLHLSIPDNVAVTRLVERGRADDTPEGIQKRLRWTHEKNAPILAWFRSNPRYRVLEINSSPPIEAVHQSVLKALNLS